MEGLFGTGFGRTWTSTGTFLGNVAALSAGVGIRVIAATLLGSGCTPLLVGLCPINETELELNCIFFRGDSKIVFIALLK